MHPSVSEETTADSTELLHNSQEVGQPAGVDRTELVDTGPLGDALQPSAVTIQSKTEMGSSPVSGGVGLVKPGSDTPTPSLSSKDITPASEGESEASTPDVVNASTSKGDTPASKVLSSTSRRDPPSLKEDTPTSKRDPPSLKEDTPTSKRDPPSQKDTPVPKQDMPTPKGDTPSRKEDTPIPKEDPPIPKEDPPTPKEDSPTPKEDPPTPKEDSPTPKEDPPTPKEDTPSPAKTQDLLESWKGCVLVTLIATLYECVSVCVCLLQSKWRCCKVTGSLGSQLYGKLQCGVLCTVCVCVRACVRACVCVL